MIYLISDVRMLNTYYISCVLCAYMVMYIMYCMRIIMTQLYLYIYICNLLEYLKIINLKIEYRLITATKSKETRNNILMRYF